MNDIESGSIGICDFAFIHLEGEGLDARLSLKRSDFGISLSSCNYEKFASSMSQKKLVFSWIVLQLSITSSSDQEVQ
jgi:hypothetical protein